MRMTKHTRRCAALGIPAATTLLLIGAAFWLASPVANGAKPAAAAGTGGGTDAGGSLREAAGKRLLVGVAVMSNQLDDPKRAAHVARQFNCLTAENEFK